MALFQQHFVRGCRYALLFVAVGAAMGLVYGLFGGRPLSPMVLAVTLTGIFVLLNFGVALVVGVVSLVLAGVGKHPGAAVRYVALSAGFMLVYLVFFGLIKWAEVEVF